MVEPHFVLPHRVLVLSELRQALCDEVFQRFQGLGTGHGPLKTLVATWVMCKTLLDQVHHLFGDGVRWEASSGGEMLRPRFSKAASVVMVKVPLSTQRVFAVHQQACFVAHFSVKVFQSQLFSILCMGLEISDRA